VVEIERSINRCDIQVTETVCDEKSLGAKTKNSYPYKDSDTTKHWISNGEFTFTNN
jgi:hypothetical protein